MVAIAFFRTAASAVFLGAACAVGAADAPSVASFRFYNIANRTPYHQGNDGGGNDFRKTHTLLFWQVMPFAPCFSLK